MHIKVEHPTVQEVFTASFYEIPAFQREYVWNEAQVTALLTDALDALFDERGSATTDEYFIGSIVAYLDPAGSVFQLIDGQQRITTLFIILCAIRDARASLNDSVSLNFLQGMLQDEYQKPDGTTGERLRLKPLYDDAGDVLERLAKGDIAVLRARKQSSKSATNMLTAYETVQEFLAEQFKDDVARIRLFQASLTQRVRMVRIQTPGISDALRIFETINDRGVGLNALDLLKNLLFMHVDKADFDRLTTDWKTMVRTIESIGAAEKPLRFLRYFVLAHYAKARNQTNKPLTEGDLYEWLSRHKQELGIAGNPLDFAKRLLKSAEAYKRFVSDPDLHLSHLYALSPRARQHLVVLLACADLAAEPLAVVTQQMERLYVAYTLAQEPTKILDSIFADAAPVLGDWLQAAPQNAGFNAALQVHLATWVDKEIDRLRPRINDALDRINIEQRKTVCRFLLCRLAQHLEAVAGSPLGTARMKHFSLFAVEHILPNTPTPEHRASFDIPAEYDHYKQLAGNLTLLEAPINASIGRDYFADKQPEYTRSGLFMTKSLGASQSVGVATGFAKAAQRLSQHAHWNSTAITTRQRELKSLAIELWAFAPRSLA